MLKHLKSKWTLMLLLLLVLGNIILYKHAYHLTHFVEKKSISTKKPIEQISFFEKVKLAFTGVQIPKPSSDILPNSNYETIFIIKDVNLKIFTETIDSIF